MLSLANIARLTVLAVAAFLVLVVLQLGGAVSLPWLLLTCPLWGASLLLVVVLVGYLVAGMFAVGAWRAAAYFLVIVLLGFAALSAAAVLL
jgi:hypothetical protein